MQKALLSKIGTGAARKCSPHRRHLRLIVSSKNCCLCHKILKLRSKCMCFPLRTVAFRGHGFSLLALAKGMSTLFAKNGFSRPSLKYCGVFRHVLGLRTARPIENLCSRRSQRSSAPNNHHNSESKQYNIVAKYHFSEGNTRRLLRESEDDETPQRAFFAREEAHREPVESVVYFRSGSGILSRSLYQLRGLKALILFDGMSNRSPSPNNSRESII